MRNITQHDKLSIAFEIPRQYHGAMEIMALAFLGFVCFVGYAPRELTKLVIMMVWILMGVWVIGVVIWSIGRALFS